MLRSVNEVIAQVREAYEDEIMDKIDRASRERKEKVTVKRDDVPAWLKARLREYGFTLFNVDVSYVDIFWGSDVK